MSVCRLVVLRNNELYYECKECSDESYKSINELNKNFPNMNRFFNENAYKCFLLLRIYGYMNAWLARKSLMKHHHQIKILFTAN